MAMDMALFIQRVTYYWVGCVLATLLQLLSQQFTAFAALVCHASEV